MEGYVKVFRSILKWEWHDDPNTGWLFVNLLLKANYEDTKWHGMVVRRGQLVTSLRKLSKETGISVQSIRTGLNRLQDTGEVTHTPTHRHTLITICKYDEYQSEKIGTNKEVTQYQHSINTVSTQPIFKNEKNVKNISSSSARVKVEDIPGYIAGLAGTSRMESMIREVYRLTGTVPDGDTMASLVQRWIDELKIQGTDEKEEQDICTHFISWARIAIPAEAKKEKKNLTNLQNQNNEKRYYLKLPDGFKPLM